MIHTVPLLLLSSQIKNLDHPIYKDRANVFERILMIDKSEMDSFDSKTVC